MDAAFSKRAPSHQMSDNNDHSGSVLGSVQQQVSHGGLKLHHKLIFTTHVDVRRASSCHENISLVPAPQKD